LSGTTIATTNSDSCSADTAAGVVMDETNSPMPGENVRYRMRPTGTISSRSR
jgi:hypothetical protein